MVYDSGRRSSNQNRLAKRFELSSEIKKMGEELLKLVEAHERGEISEEELLREWKKFMRFASESINKLIN